MSARQRKPKQEEKVESASSPLQISPEREAPKKSRLSTLFSVGLVFTLLLFGLYYTTPDSHSKPTEKKVIQRQKEVKVFSKEELAQYDGSDPSKPLYLSVLGEVYDVSKGKKHYGPSGMYSGFCGKDGSRAFVTGIFTKEGLVEDLRGLSAKEIKDVYGWRDFYDESPDYLFVGKLHGKYYDDQGKPTAELRWVEGEVGIANAEAEAEAEEKLLQPPCNSRWSKKTGGEVWCSTGSGGVKRDWEGVPRRKYRIGKEGYKCVCARSAEEASKDPTLRTYPNCPTSASRCPIPEQE